MTFGTCHLVASEILDNLDLALGTISNESFTHGFFDLVSFREPFILSKFFAGSRYMAFLFAKTTASYLA